MYTLQIDVQSAAPLDGTTPLNINAPGVTVDKVTNRTIIVTLDGALVPAFGRIDPGQVIEDQIPTLAGKPLLLIGFSATSSAGTYIGVGNTLSRVTPLQGAQEAVQELANLGEAGVQGVVFGQPEIFPLAHLSAITTLPAGPTRLIFVLKALTDDDVAALGCCDPDGVNVPLVTEDEGALVEADTTLYNFLGAGVTAAPAGPPGAVDVTIPGGLALELDMTLAPLDGPTLSPFRFIDMPPIMAQLALLPTIGAALGPIPNRIWLGSFDFGVDVTPGVYPLENSDVRGGDPSSSFAFPSRGQTFVASGPDGVQVLANTKRVVDLEIDAGPPGNAGPFFNTVGVGTYLENVTTFAPENGPLGLPPFVDTAGGRWDVDRCQFGTSVGIEARGAATVAIVVEDSSSFGPFSLQGPGFIAMEVRGTGNTFDELMGAAVGTLDIDIGNVSLIGSPTWSGAESINFGAGVGSLAPGGPLLLYPGGGDPASAPALIVGGPDFPAEVGFKDGILRGIHVNVGGVVVADFIDIDILVGGVVVYTEPGVFIIAGIGSFVSTTFGFMSAGGFARPISMIVRPPAGGTTASWGYINVGVLIK